ncbi:hypothetical protein LNJ05_00020 [Tenacibaculum finnmarkense genomovar ulcerans]|uniref:hypothetical protein n=1 Tax=Tenacibaculum finnmarkense TaxID=2781243 RepID=UPI001E55D9B8|nr:hypothetical protein [Tenacibaculum finnmarkense]MCD8431156.1 hypothetical protein [Tenacibaculum finnmarkense genomovar ulcerans]
MNLKRTEKTVLNNLLNIIPANKMLLTVYYNCAGIVYSDELLQDEIQTQSEFLKNVTKVEVEVYKMPSVTIHGTNARLLINRINEFNQQSEYFS